MIYTSLIVCLICTIIGYFFLFYGAHATDSRPALSFKSLSAYISLVIGYILMWPTILYGYLQSLFTDDNNIDLRIAIIAQIIGYLFIGYLYGHAKSHYRNT